MEQSTVDPTPTVSVKSTKQEVLDAYQALLKQHRAQVPTQDDPKRARQHAEAQQTLEVNAKFKTSDDVAAAVGQTRAAVNHALNAIQQQMEEGVRALSSLREAVHIQETRVKEWYAVEDAAQGLIALLRAREETERTNADVEVQRKEQRKREEDAYHYELDQRKRRDDEERRVRREEFESELRLREETIAKRETAATEREAEFMALKTDAAQFPQQLARAQEEARKEMETRMSKEAETSLFIAQKESETRAAVDAARIESHQQTIERQREQLRVLQEQLQAALTQIQEVALKTIEGSADRRALQAVNQFAMQRAPGNTTPPYHNTPER